MLTVDSIRPHPVASSVRSRDPSLVDDDDTSFETKHTHTHKHKKDPNLAAFPLIGDHLCTLASLAGFILSFRPLSTFDYGTEDRYRLESSAISGAGIPASKDDGSDGPGSSVVFIDYSVR